MHSWLRLDWRNAGVGREWESVARLAALGRPSRMGRVTRRVTHRPPRRAPFQDLGTVVAEPILLTSAQAANLLQVSVDTLLTLDIRFVPLGNGKKRPHRGYLRDTLIEWCKRREAPAA